MGRRTFLRQFAALPLFTAGAVAPAEPSKKPLKIMLKSAWGSDDPTKAAFAFFHGYALAEADLANFGARFGSPAIFVSIVEWADRVIAE